MNIIKESWKHIINGSSNIWYHISCKRRRDSVNRSIGTQQADPVNRSIGTRQPNPVNRSISTSQADSVNRSISTSQADSVNRSISTPQADSVVNRSIGTRQPNPVNRSISTSQADSVNRSISTSQADSVNRSISTSQADSVVNRSISTLQADSVNRSISTLQADSVNRSISSISTPQADSVNSAISMEYAKKRTIALIQQKKGANPVTIGHGILLKSKTGNKYQYVIVSAAHVTVGGADSYSKGTLKKIRFSSGAEIEIVSVDKCFIPDDYYNTGARDVGGLLVTLRPAPPAILKTSSLKVPQDDPDTTTIFTGNASGWLIHSSVMEPDPNVYICEGRVQLANPSKPGCSGTPLFSPTGDFLAVLHGSGKDRGDQRGGHTGNEDCHIRSETVFVDLVKNFNDQKAWGKQYYRFLEYLELITPKELKLPKVYFSEEEAEDQVEFENTPGFGGRHVYDFALGFLKSGDKVFKKVGREFTIQALCNAIKVVHDRADDGNSYLSEYLEINDSTVEAVVDPEIANHSR